MPTKISQLGRSAYHKCMILVLHIIRTYVHTSSGSHYSCECYGLWDNRVIIIIMFYFTVLVTNCIIRVATIFSTLIKQNVIVLNFILGILTTQNQVILETTLL